ncbi:MAG: PfkB family carbohydrate kinase [bacterium]
MKEKVLIVGSVAYDTIETAAGKVERTLGGAATYSSVAASFYCTPCMVAVVGEDFQDGHIEYFTGCGIDLCGLQREKGKTFQWVGRYHEDMIGRETLDTQLNVFENFDPVLPDELKKLKYVFLANIHPGMQKRVLEQVENPEFVLCDTMDLWINTAREELMELLPGVDVLVINDEEVRMLTGDYNIYRAARKLIDMGVKRGMVVKRGEHGSTLVTKDEIGFAPAFPIIELVDPTGAGDSFAGAIIGHLAAEGEVSTRTLRSSLIRGAAVSSFTVEGFGVERLLQINGKDIESRIKALCELMIVE